MRNRVHIQASKSVAMPQSRHKGLIRAFEQRMDTLGTLPLLSDRVNDRWVHEIQTRLPARFMTGEPRSYPGLETR